jgi:hypothetical protein
VEVILTVSITMCHMLWKFIDIVGFFIFILQIILRMQMSPIRNLKKRKPVWYWSHRGLWSHCAWWYWGRWEVEKPQQLKWKFKHPTVPAPGAALGSVCATRPLLALLVPCREGTQKSPPCASCTEIHGCVLRSQAAQC